MYYLGQLFKVILQTSITTSILICLLLIFRKYSKGRLGIKFQYTLWFLVIFRLTIFKLPESPFSIFNIINGVGNNILLLFSNKTETFGTVLARSGSKISSLDNHDVILRTINSMDFSTDKVMNSSLSGMNIFSFIWLIGVIFIFAYILFVYRGLRRKINNNGKSNNNELLSILKQCKNEMSIKKEIALVETSIVKIPALFGYFKPVILIPNNINKVIDVDKLRYIFLHELSHLKRRDIVINWIIIFLKVIYWFNPIIHYGFRKNEGRYGSML